MLKKLKNLSGYKIQSSDGDVGHIQDFYFDEQLWTIRYLVVNTGNWLIKNLVLVSPIFVDEVDDENEMIKISLSKKQLEQSPDVDTARPISRQKEIEMSRYYQSGLYWSGFSTWGMTPNPAGLRGVPTPVTKPMEDLSSEEFHLRSMDEVLGYSIESGKEDLGHIKDFLLNQENWQIDFFVLNTKTLLPGEDLEFSIRWIQDISWEEREIHLKQRTRELQKS